MVQIGDVADPDAPIGLPVRLEFPPHLWGRPGRVIFYATRPSPRCSAGFQPALVAQASCPALIVQASCLPLPTRRHERVAQGRVLPYRPPACATAAPVAGFSACLYRASCLPRPQAQPEAARMAAPQPRLKASPTRLIRLYCDRISDGPERYRSGDGARSKAMLPTYQILLTGLGTIRPSARHLLESFDVDSTHPVERGLLAAVRRTGFDVVIAATLASRCRWTPWFDALRDPDAGQLPRRAGRVAEPRGRNDARPTPRRGVNRVVTRTDPDRVIQESVLSLIDVPRPLPGCGPVEICPPPTTPPVRRGATPRTCQCPAADQLPCARRRRLPARLRAALPRGGAADPRPRPRRSHRDPRREKVLGVGAAFESFAHSDRSACAARCRGGSSDVDQPADQHRAPADPVQRDRAQ